MEDNNMSRNLKREYIHKLIKLEVPDGYKFDLANYLHNPSYEYEYPSFCRTISEDDAVIVQRRVLYFKHYDGSGEYIEKFMTFDKRDAGSWKIAKKVTENILERSSRFNLNKLVSLI